MASCPRLCLVSLCLLGFLLGVVPAAARADADKGAVLRRAKAHYLQGKTFYEQGNFQLARAEFEESFRLSKRPDLLFNLALVAEKLGSYREAADYLAEYLRQRPDARDRREIQRSIDELERREAQLRQQEEAQRPRPAADAPGAPGTEPKAPEPLARPVLVPVAPVEKPRRGTPPIAALALLGGGVALVAVGAGLGGAAMAAARSVEQRFDPSEQDRGRALQAAGIVLDVLGGAAIVAGGAWTLHRLGRRGEKERVSIAPRGLGLAVSGSF